VYCSNAGVGRRTGQEKTNLAHTSVNPQDFVLMNQRVMFLSDRVQRTKFVEESQPETLEARL
jgi:hypothetical protein